MTDDMTTPRANRLFVAAIPSDALLRELVAVAADLAETTGGHAVPEANLHLTLAFLGAVAEPELSRLVRVLPERLARCRSARVAIGEVTPRPSAARARLLAVTMHDLDDALADLSSTVAQALGSPPRDATGVFWPHVTVTRFRRPTHVKRFPPPEGEHVFDFSRVGLYDSHMTRGGPPRYREVLGVTLSTQSQRSSLNG